MPPTRWNTNHPRRRPRIHYELQQSNTKSKELLYNIQEGYVPYVETANILSFELINLQREFQDAVGAADEEKLVATKEK